jgi:hypothetical protein
MVTFDPAGALMLSKRTRVPDRRTTAVMRTTGKNAKSFGGRLGNAITDAAIAPAPSRSTANKRTV